MAITLQNTQSLIYLLTLGQSGLNLDHLNQFSLHFMPTSKPKTEIQALVDAHVTNTSSLLAETAAAH